MAQEVFTKEEVSEIMDGMARTIALLYYHMSKEVVAAFGKEGEEAIRLAIKKYGTERGETVKKIVLEHHEPLTVRNLSRFYDLPLGKAWKSTKLCDEENKLEKRVTCCPFAEVWKEKKGEKLGLIYCEQDLHMRKSYNENIAFKQLTNVLHGDGDCHTIVEIK